MMKIKAHAKALQLRESFRSLERMIGLVDESQLRCCDMTLAQCHALVEIGRGNDLSLNCLSQVLSLDNSTLSRTVNHLVLSGLAERYEDPADRRYIKIRLTGKGMKNFQSIEQMMNTYFEKIYTLIPEEKRDQVIESLQILNQVCVNTPCCPKEKNNEE